MDLRYISVVSIRSLTTPILADRPDAVRARQTEAALSPLARSPLAVGRVGPCNPRGPTSLARASLGGQAHPPTSRVARTDSGAWRASARTVAVSMSEWRG